MRAAVAAAAVVAAATACGFPRPSEEFACDTTADCTGDRVCQQGYCVLPSTGADAPPGAADAGIDAVVIDAAVLDAAPITLAFQDGTGGYDGTMDTFIDGGQPTGNGGGLSWIEWEYIGSQSEHALIRFDGVFGGGATQVPPGSTIIAATLRLTVYQPTAAPGELREIAIDWDGTTTHANFGAQPGLQPGDVGAVVTDAPMSGVAVLDVTASLQGWSMDPTQNRGWAISPVGTLNDNCEVRSSEYGALSDRPMLAVTYVP